MDRDVRLQREKRGENNGSKYSKSFLFIDTRFSIL